MAIIELGFDDLPALYLIELSQKKKEFRKLFGHNSQYFLTPRRIIIKLDQYDQNIRTKILEFLYTGYKSMKWAENQSTPFVRPLRWILSLDKDKLINLDILGVHSSNFTFSHRAIGNKKIFIQSEEEYFQKIRADGKVEFSHIERREKIRQILKDAGISEDETDDILDIQTFSTEFVDFIQEHVDSEGIPPKIAESIIRETLFLFPIKSKSGSVLGDKVVGFIGIIDNPSADKEKVIQGYKFVIRSRFDDALFYIKEDRRIPFSQRIHELDKIVFNEKFGSFYDRAVFLSKIADFIQAKTGLSSRTKIRRASMLSKADITTGLFREFPEHQGYIGMFYLISEGEDEEVAKAVYEHRLPVRQGDQLPETETGIVLSVADKITHIITAFLTGIEVRSEEDPYGIRRAARGLLRILTELRIDVDFEELFNFLSPLIASHYTSKGIDFSEELISQKLNSALDFLKDRLEVFLSEKFKKDIVKGVIARCFSPYDAMLRVKALSENDFSSLFYVARRVGNILEQARHKGFLETVDSPELKFEVEMKLLQEALELEKSNLVEQKKYPEFVARFDGIRKVIDDFFNSVVVLTNNDAERKARLTILSILFHHINKFADFSEIEKR